MERIEHGFQGVRVPPRHFVWNGRLILTGVGRRKMQFGEGGRDA